jgi:hypothetical protein
MAEIAPHGRSFPFRPISRLSARVPPEGIIPVLTCSHARTGISVFSEQEVSPANPDQIARPSQWRLFPSFPRSGVGTDVADALRPSSFGSALALLGTSGPLPGDAERRSRAFPRRTVGTRRPWERDESPPVVGVREAEAHQEVRPPDRLRSHSAMRKESPGGPTSGCRGS